jgi:hypothetical protein
MSSESLALPWLPLPTVDETTMALPAVVLAGGMSVFASETSTLISCGASSLTKSDSSQWSSLAAWMFSSLSDLCQHDGSPAALCPPLLVLICIGCSPSGMPAPQLRDWTSPWIVPPKATESSPLTTTLKGSEDAGPADAARSLAVGALAVILERLRLSAISSYCQLLVPLIPYGFLGPRANTTTPALGCLSGSHGILMARSHTDVWIHRFLLEISDISVRDVSK